MENRNLSLKVLTVYWSCYPRDVYCLTDVDSTHVVVDWVGNHVSRIFNKREEAEKYMRELYTKAV